jgi:hypothetical protein
MNARAPISDPILSADELGKIRITLMKTVLIYRRRMAGCGRIEAPSKRSHRLSFPRGRE